jgi:phosphoribosylaminoimidazole carboxylase (NCAIR synthetase)
MIVVMKPDAESEDVRRVCRRIGEAGLEAHVSRGRRRTVVGCVGDESALADVPLAALSGVEDVLQTDTVSLHWYGKREVYNLRKMGHITSVGSEPASVLSLVREVRDWLTFRD